MKKKLLINLIFTFVTTFHFSANANELKCENFRGEWKGNKKGTGYQGEITILFEDNCKYKWIKRDGYVLTPGEISIKKNNSIEYANQAGSRGRVTLKENTLIWVNTYTGNSYEVLVKKN